MALIPEVTFNYQVDGFRIQDITGRYAVDSNTGGWGSPNEDYAAITSAIITLKNETTLALKTYDVTDQITGLTNQEVITFGPYPSLGDGLYKVTYSLTTTVDYSDISCKFFMPNIDCCVDGLIADLIKNDCDYKYIKKVLQIEAQRQALKKSAYSLNSERVTYFINKLKLICTPCANA
jgi:hypothetical protein